MKSFKILKANKSRKGVARSYLVQLKNGKTTWLDAKMLKANGKLTNGGKTILNKLGQLAIN